MREDAGERHQRRWQDALHPTIETIAGLTAVDGATVITNEFEVLAFGAKIGRRDGWTRVGTFTPEHAWYSLVITVAPSTAVKPAIGSMAGWLRVLPAALVPLAGIFAHGLRELRERRRRGSRSAANRFSPRLGARGHDEQGSTRPCVRIETASSTSTLTSSSDAWE